MSLSSGEWWLSGGSQNMRDTYCLIFTIGIPTAFQLVAMDAGGGGVGVYNVILDLGNDRVGA